uniref:ATP-dependent Clp protease proteolytic subunit n=1 Tax=Salix viminalis TaxID=40686 RepID=A0A6N2KPU9_SALVM
MVGASAISAPAAGSSIFPRTKSPSLSLFSHRRNSVVSALPRPYSDSSTSRLSVRIDGKGFRDANQSYVTVEAKGGNPPIMPAVMTPGGPLDLSSVLFRNRIIFIGQPINSQVAQRVISQLVTLATIDEKSDILLYLNCPGGSTYSVLGIYDCMSWIKPKVGTVCFGAAKEHFFLLEERRECGMQCLMHGHVEDVRRQVNEAVQAHKIDQMYATFTGQPLEKVQQYTERDRFLSTSEAMEFGLIDGILETEY